MANRLPPIDAKAMKKLRAENFNIKALDDNYRALWERATPGRMYQLTPTRSLFFHSRNGFCEIVETVDGRRNDIAAQPVRPMKRDGRFKGGVRPSWD